MYVCMYVSRTKIQQVDPVKSRRYWRYAVAQKDGMRCPWHGPARHVAAAGAGLGNRNHDQRANLRCTHNVENTAARIRGYCKREA